MSFILDALKKSESDRQRQSGPALFEVKIAPPKARFPLWAIGVAALLIVNMLVIGWLLVRHASKPDELGGSPPPANAAASQASAVSGPAPNGTNTPSATWGGGSPALTGTAPVASPGTAPVGSASGQSVASLPASAASPVSIPSPPQDPGGHIAADSLARGGPGSREPTLARTGKAEAEDQKAASGSNPDDDIPATDVGPQQEMRGHVHRGTESGLTLYQDAALVAGSNLPQLRLDLHVYAAKPQDRFALVNMQKVREGDQLPQGVHVDSIVPDGVVMSHNGTRFLLPRD